MAPIVVLYLGVLTSSFAGHSVSPVMITFGQVLQVVALAYVDVVSVHAHVTDNG